MNSLAVIAALGAVVVAAAVFFVVGRRLGAIRGRQSELERQAAARASAEETAARIVGDAEREVDTMRKGAVVAGKEEVMRLREAAEAELRGRRSSVEGDERRVNERESALDRKLEGVDLRDRDLARRASDFGRREKLVLTREDELEKLVADERRRLEQMAGMSAQDAKNELIRRLEEEAHADAANTLREIRESARRNAEREAKKIVALAIQRIAADTTAETTVSAVSLPNDEMKGRIIGREGRNIRALELATGVELIVDDTPGAIILSSFDPYRREVARQSIECLIADGRIHPARIEEVVEKVKADVDDSVRKEGEVVAFELGLFDVRPELLQLMGRLKFRTSYGQNVLSHSKEVAYLAGIMARELGLSTQVAVRAAFLHDIGKAVDREMQGTHLEIGVDLLRAHGESQAVVDAVAAHHMDIAWPSLEAMIVQAADAISAARPGARRDILESYVKRLEKLEDIADSFTGVSKSFALQAGREIRIMVQSEQVTDEGAIWLSKDIARRIENELQYPGQIKVTVIRETRATEIAR